MTRWKKWEIALLLGLCVTLLWGAWSVQRQEELSQKLVRLHIIANSDSAEDQAIKLKVRDSVLAYTTGVLQRSADMADARRRLENSLDRIEDIARQTLLAQGCDASVTAQLARAEFPLKEYDGFSLPAGEYTALRLVIGEGRGQNWWCVVYPPLCTAAAARLPETATAGGMTEEDLGLITEENTGYVLRFRSLELWEWLRQWLGK